MAATKPAFTPPGKKGDMIFSALVKLAALIVLLMLGGIIVSLIISSFSRFPRGSFIIPDHSGRRCSAIAVFFSVPVPIPLISCSSSDILISVSGSSAWKPKNKENGTRLQ